jgi:hypothetical protein
VSARRAGIRDRCGHAPSSSLRDGVPLFVTTTARNAKRLTIQVENSGAPRAKLVRSGATSLAERGGPIPVLEWLNTCVPARRHVAVIHEGVDSGRRGLPELETRPDFNQAESSIGQQPGGGAADI